MGKRKHKITILLGAGFACYMKGTSTEEINKLFAEDKRYNDYYNGEEFSLFNYTQKVFSEYYDFSFETFLAILEQIIDYRLGTDLSGQVSTQDRPISSTLFAPSKILLDSLFFSMTIKELWSAYTHFINIIIDAVSRYDSIDYCLEQANAFQNYITALSCKYEKIKLYSTNYDSLCHQILSSSGIYTSTIGSPWITDEKDFVYNIADYNNHPLTYFPLHGCTKLKREFCNHIKYCSFEQKLSDIAIDNSAGNPNGQTLFTPIISGYNKLQHINGKPFVFGTQVFANDLQDSDTILTLGYSYSDTHINSYLATFPKTKISSVTLDRVWRLPIDLDIEQREMDLSSYFSLHSL